RFDWPLANEAETLLRARISDFLEGNSFARRLAERMRDGTGTDFYEWTDHIVLSPNEEKSLQAVGFVRDDGAETPDGEAVFEHPRATLPRVRLRRGEKRSPATLALRPEFVAEFIAAHNVAGEPEGEPLSRYRRI